MTFWKSSPPSGIQVNWLHPLSRGLVGCWLFNDGSGEQVLDIAGNNHGTLTNMDAPTDWVGGKDGWALDFDGTNDYVRIEDNAAHRLQSPMSIVMEAKRDTLGDADIYISKITQWSEGYLMQTVAGDKIRFYYNGASNHTSTGTIGTDWETVAVVIKEDYINIYINGLFDSSKYVASYTPSSKVLTIGASLDNDEATIYSAGDIKISYCCIYNRGLFSAEVEQLHYEKFCFLQPRRRYFVPPAVGIAPTSTLYGPLAGPLGGVI
jgi:hypothetical protein